MSREQKPNNNRYYIVVDGTFRTGVAETHPEAVRREYEDKKTGKKGVKFERVVPALFGKIEDISIYTGDYGKTINLTLDPDEDGKLPVISVSTNSRYGEMLMKLLPNVDFSQEVRIRPYSFIGDSDKEVRGIEITTKDPEGKFTVKVPNFFFADGKTLNGYPSPSFETEGASTEEWKIYYAQANLFLVKYTENNIVPKFQSEKRAEVEYPEESINPEDIPF